MPVFSTASIPVRQKFEAWRHVITQQFLPLRPEPVPRAKFWGEVGGGALDSISIARVCASGQVVHRAGREMSQSSPDALFVNVHVAGMSALECGVNAHRMSKGDLFFVDGQRPFRLHCEEPMHHVVAAIPMQQLRAVLRRPDLAGRRSGSARQRCFRIAVSLPDQCRERVRETGHQCCCQRRATCCRTRCTSLTERHAACRCRGMPCSRPLCTRLSDHRDGFWRSAAIARPDREASECLRAFSTRALSRAGKVLDAPGL